MQSDSQTAFEQDLNSAFVLSASLYYRLIATDGPRRDPLIVGWHDALHDTARDLSALSDGWSDAESVAAQLSRGISDLLHSLRDLSEMAANMDQPDLSAELRSHAARFEEQLDVNDVRGSL
ncbi:MAG: hypothetical protein AAFQ47_08735 [Pseudomonadota bacterium]